MLRVAIIGTGNISTSHIDSYLKFPERCEIVALCDIKSEKCKLISERYNLSTPLIFDSHKTLIESADFDLVSICTPPYCHAEITIDCLNAGKHVLVEKPMASSLEECDKMIAAAKASGKLLSVVAQNRFRDPIWNLKRVIDSGKIGKIVHAQVDSHWWRGLPYYDIWWRGTWKMEGGGCTLNHAVHHIDMLGWIMGLPDEVCAMLTNTSHNNSEVEDLSCAVMRYDGGALAQVTSSVVHHGEEQQIVFHGEKARVSAPWRAVSQKSRPNGHPEPNPEFENELCKYYKSLPTVAYEGHVGQIDDVLSTIESGGSPMIGGADGRLTIELITAIYKAGTEKVTVALPIAKDDKFYTVEGIIASAPRFFEKTGYADDLDGEITFGSDYKY